MKKQDRIILYHYFFKKKIHPTASHEPTLPNSISSSPYFPNKLLLLGKRCALAVFQYIFLSPIIIGLNIPSQLPLNKVRVHTLPIRQLYQDKIIWRLYNYLFQSISSTLPFPQQIIYIGKKYATAIPQSLFFSPKIIGLYQYLTTTPLK